MEENYIIRRYHKGDEKEINTLFKEIFNVKRSIEEWAWKFKKNPLGHINLITVAESGGKVVGQYANLPGLYQCRDKTLKVGLPVDNFVHPSFSGGLKGIQGKMFEYQHEVARKENISFGIGFPNRDAYVIGKRVLKYKDIGKIPVLFKRMNWRLAIKRRFPWFPAPLLAVVQFLSSIGYEVMIREKKQIDRRKIKINTITSFDGRFDLFWDKVKKQYAIIGVRDQRYLNWRYRKPGVEYEIFAAEEGSEIRGYLVMDVKRDDSTVTGYLVDMLTDDSAVDSILINHALKRLASKRVDYVLCWMLSHRKEYSELCRAGFIENRHSPINAVYYIFNYDGIDEVFIKDIRNWSFTMADSDVF